jgi:hypothetical protein
MGRHLAALKRIRYTKVKIYIGSNTHIFHDQKVLDACHDKYPTSPNAGYLKINLPSSVTQDCTIVEICLQLVDPSLVRNLLSEGIWINAQRVQISSLSMLGPIIAEISCVDDSEKGNAKIPQRPRFIIDTPRMLPHMPNHPSSIQTRQPFRRRTIHSIKETNHTITTADAFQTTSLPDYEY